MSLRGFRAQILSVAQDPRVHGPQALRYEEDGLLIVDGGIVTARGSYAQLAPKFTGVPIETFPDKLIVPGFVDTHVHFPQIDSIAAYGEQLLEWLQKHIFPAEMRYSDEGFAAQSAAFFCDELLRNGTTSALVFPTVHPQSVDAFFAEANARNLRMICGKVLMDLGPEGLRDTPETGYSQSAALIKRWHGTGRLGYAATPRFAVTSSPEQLQAAGALVKSHPDVLMHTHLSENHSEIAQVARQFPSALDYTDVYGSHGLVGANSVFAHGIHLSDRECGELSQAGSTVAFCPTSNLFLGSGLLDLQRLFDVGVHVALGSDVGAGTSLSMLQTQGTAYQVAQMRGLALDPFRSLYLATTAGAMALGVEDKIGSLEIGQEADFLVLDPAATPLLARRTASADLRDRLFAMQILGDDRCIFATYILGQCAHWRDPGYANLQVQKDVA